MTWAAWTSTEWLAAWDLFALPVVAITVVAVLLIAGRRKPTVKFEEAVIIRPGDTLIVRVGQDINMQQIDELKTGLMDFLLDVSVAVMQGAEQIAVYRPGGQQ